MNKKTEILMSLAKRRGIVFQGSEIYGGLANTWDYGPVGVELKNNIKRQWWKSFVQLRLDVVGLDSAILMNQAVWEASGHVGGFSDPLIDCKNCKNRFRADKLLEDYFQKKNIEKNIEGISHQEIDNLIIENKIRCSICGEKEFTKCRQFNLMFKTYQGVTNTSQDLVYLRPETAQGIFVNFKNVATALRKKVPFGVAQIGKAFRNEISPGNFIFRTREFEQMELEYFCHPNEAIAEFEKWQDYCYKWLFKIGLRSELLNLRKHEKEELSHYSKATTDIEFKFPFGWGELWGIAHRGDFDLKQHQNKSGKDMQYFDSKTNEKYLPNVIEPSLGVDRLLLAVLANSYQEDEIKGEKRVFLKLNKLIAPYQVAVLPLTKKQAELARKITTELSKYYTIETDENGSIGKRYRRCDEIGIPYCVTIDYETESDKMVTIRERDTTKQDRVLIEKLSSYFLEKFDD